MVVPFVLFFLLLGWSLYDGEIYPKQAGVLFAIWFGLLMGFCFWKVFALWFVVPTVLLDIGLILKIFGKDIQIR